LVSSSIALAIAAKACGGRVIAQVRRVVARGERPASMVRLPGMFVDQIVVDPDMMMTTETPFDPAFFGGVRRPLSEIPTIPLTPDKVIARRAAREVRPQELSIFGFGAAADVPLVMVEDGTITEENIDDYWFTTEHGSYGGVVMSGWQFSANLNPEAIVDGITQFDIIDGGLCEFAALAFAQYDSQGVVNVSKFANANPGAGGFTDIAMNARRLVFTGTFTTAGLSVDYAGGQMRITQEGKVRKFARDAEHVTYRVGEGVRDRGQSAVIITERAVFEVTPEGLVLTEVAPGVDVRRDVLDQMEFAPVHVLDPLPRMDSDLFIDRPSLQKLAG
jgi:propionate CoA-transferase